MLSLRVTTLPASDNERTGRRRLHSPKQMTLPSVVERNRRPLAAASPSHAGNDFNRISVSFFPVVASATPANVRAASLAGLGDRVLCSTNTDWENILKGLHARPEDRLAVASAGQATALTAYSEESLAERWDRLFRSL